MSAAKRTTKRAATKVEAPSVITLRYELAELPSAQHRAGLAGLVLMVRRVASLGDMDPGTCEVTTIDDLGATFRFDPRGLARLFDETYAADRELVPKKQQWKDKSGNIISPERVEEIDVPDGKGKVKKEKRYYYPVVVPKAGLLADLEPASADGSTLWIKLWRDMVWETLRGVPATREPFDARAERRPTGDDEKAWAVLSDPDAGSVDLPSTYYLGAQAMTADNVPFKDKARFQFLLHFWPYAAQVYVPRAVDPNEGTDSFGGYAITVPDVASLEPFCDLLPDVLRARSPEPRAYRPKEAVIDLPAEGALDLELKLAARAGEREGAKETGAFLLGCEVYHLEKQGNNVRLRSAARVEAEPKMVAEYTRLRGLELWSPIFRKQRVLNVLTSRPWYAGFDKLLETVSQSKVTIGSPAFRHDARLSFDVMKKEREVEMEDAKEGPLTVEDVVYQVVQGYVLNKLKSKYSLAWETSKGDPKDYYDKRLKIAKDAFLAVRSRTNEAFVDYFASTIASAFNLSQDRYKVMASELKSDPGRVRTLTLLALSAVG